MTDKADKTTLPEKIVLEFPSFGRLTFTSLEQVTEFLRGERAAWSNLSRPGGVPAIVHSGADAIFAKLSAADRSLTDYRNQLAANQEAPNATVQKQKYFERLKDSLVGFQTSPFLHSRSALAQRILQKSATDLATANLALTFAVMPGPIQSNSFAQMDARLVPGTLMFLQQSNPFEGAEIALSELQRAWSQRFVEQQVNYEGALQELALSRSQIEADIERKREELQSRQIDCERQVKDHGDTLSGIEAHYRERMLLKAPAEYWQHKYEAHRDMAMWCFLGMSIVVGCIVYGAFHLAPWILDQVSHTNADAASGWVGEIALVTVPAIAAFWILRSVSRLFVQQTQRMGDAHERNTMVKTYLALLTEPNHKVENSERLVILHALFRPGPGDPPDNEGTASILEAFSKLK